MKSIHILNQAYLYVQASIEKITQWKYWEIKLAILLSIFSLITSFPDYHTPLTFVFNILQHQFDHPLTPAAQLVQSGEAQGIVSHMDKTWIRIFIPIIGYFTGIKAQYWFIIQHFLGFGFFFVVLKTLNKYVQDPVSSALFAMGIACIFASKWIFNDLFIFDGTAYFLMALALYFRQLVIVGVLLLTAYFIDERVIMITPAILLWWYLNDSGVVWNTRSVIKVASVFMLLVLIYAGTRFYLIHTYGFQNGTSQVGVKLMVYNFKYIPVGFLLHAEAFWLMIGCVTILLWQNGLKMFSLGLIGMLLGMNILCFIVFDVSRSTGYLFPFLWIYVWLLTKYTDKEEYRRILFICGVLCLLIPTHNICIDGIFWMSPVFPKILKLFVL